MTLFRAAVLAAIFASMVLVLDYQNPAMRTFCGASSGCAEVQGSELSHDIQEFLQQFVPVGLPHLGLFSCLVLLVVSFTLRPSASTSVGPDGRTYAQPTFIRGRVAILAGLSGLGGVLGAVLVVAQAKIHAFCLYCMIVDTSMMFAAACAIVLWRVTPEETAATRGLAASMTVPIIAAWSVLATAAIGLPFVWTLYPTIPPPPKEIAALQQPGKLTIVSMTDFECPYCRKLHPNLTAARTNPDVVFKRVMAPLVFHVRAIPAARTYLCVPEDRRDEAAEALYTMPIDEITSESLEKVAADLGVTRDAYLACYDAESTTQALVDDLAFFDAVMGEGSAGKGPLPATYVGRYPVIGADAKRLDALVKGWKSMPIELPTWLLHALSAALLLAVAGFSWRRASDVPTP